MYEIAPVLQFLTKYLRVMNASFDKSCLVGTMETNVQLESLWLAQTENAHASFG